MSFDIFLQYLLNGLMLGVIYAIVAVGFTLYFGVLDVIKFSHGDILMASPLILALLRRLLRPGCNY